MDITITFKYLDNNLKEEFCVVTHIYEPLSKVITVFSSLRAPINLKNIEKISPNQYIKYTEDVYPEELKLQGNPINIISHRIVNCFLFPECYPNILHNSIIEVIYLFPHTYKMDYRIILTMIDGVTINLPTSDGEYYHFKFGY